MKNKIVLSVNDNQDYLYFVPLVMWAWRYFGWEPILFYNQSHANRDAAGKPNTLAWIEKLLDDNGVPTPKFIKSIDGYRSDTITQISRLYASWVINEPSLLMTGDIDMLPLSDYWGPSSESVTVYGHDLTGYGHYPICYISAPDVAWDSIMMRQELTRRDDYNEAIKVDLDLLPQAKNQDFYKYWFTDQDLITSRLNEYGKDRITFINRGQGTHGYARGRVDRGNGGWVLNQPELIDAHLIQQAHHRMDRVGKILDLLIHVWPKEDWTWFLKYTEEFRKLTGHNG